SQSKTYGGDGGFATDAQLHHPEGVWATPDRTVYISDSENDLVRKVTPDGKIATIAGDANAAARAAASNQYPIPGSSDGDGGPATAAHLNGPRGIAVDSGGNVYVAEETGARFRRLDRTGSITTPTSTSPPSNAPPATTTTTTTTTTPRASGSTTTTTSPAAGHQPQPHKPGKK